MDWPLNKPASEVLRLPGGGHAPEWAQFDPDWYRARHGGSDDDAELMSEYLALGQRQGRSPNRWFDEAWYRARYPGVARAVEDGAYASGFDNYFRGGCLDRAPHWLFDEALYRRENADLTDDLLRAQEVFNGYDHYLRHGDREGRVGHRFLDAKAYAAQFPPDIAQAARDAGAFRHFLTARTGGAEPRTTPYFDPTWYLRQYPAVARAIAAGAVGSALEHYLGNATPTLFDPSPWFSENWYIASNPGLAEAIGPDRFRNGYAHFLTNGARELRAPSPGFDLRWYADQPPVRAALERGEAPDAFTHFVAIGAARGLPTAPPEAAIDAAAPAEALARRRARATAQAPRARGSISASTAPPRCRSWRRCATSSRPLWRRWRRCAKGSRNPSN